MILNLEPDRLSGLSGPEVLQLVIEACAEERNQCAQIAETMATRELNRAAEVAQSIAAQIRARTP